MSEDPDDEEGEGWREKVDVPGMGDLLVVVVVVVVVVGWGVLDVEVVEGCSMSVEFKLRGCSGVRKPSPTSSNCVSRVFKSGIMMLSNNPSSITGTLLLSFPLLKSHVVSSNPCPSKLQSSGRRSKKGETSPTSRPGSILRSLLGKGVGAVSRLP